jgi:serine/threonine-protein kinase
MSGRSPFAERQGLRVLWAHLHDEPPDPFARRTDLPPGIDAGAEGGSAQAADKAAHESVIYARALSTAARIPSVKSAG